MSSFNCPLTITKPYPRGIVSLLFLVCALLLSSSSAGQSQNRERIFFDSEMDQKNIPSFEIFSVYPNGTGLRQHTFDAVPRRANSSPRFSPDGKHVIFGTYKYGGYKIAIANSDFTKQRKFTKGPHYTYVGSWSPNGKKVAYNKVDTERAPYFQGDFEIFVMNLDQSHDVNISNTKGSDFGPQWLPDGKKILFGSDRSGNSDIYIMDEDGENVKNITNTPEIDEFGFSLSPDGSKIAFHLIHREAKKKYIDLYTMNTDGTQRKNLTKNQVTQQNLFVPYYDGAPPIFYGSSWSIDGKKIAFSSKRNSSNFQIFTIRSNGQELKQLTHNNVNNVFPFWVIEK
ncbi:hypothetical protein DKG77_00770 [Flagellimonas aquimarina]|uniref:DUF5050 domain-containing protein n=1 Tax=Flagellimonas aquimarina TaxID=2201895 RepID=A0A316KZX4_9FLAO|nr:PD40 domain-containing protein [Allomuricauda koreensis]PWL39404.1 hypothetical protein DKG77_00770 [Allomuricauda koreensis]